MIDGGSLHQTMLIKKMAATEIDVVPMTQTGLRAQETTLIDAPNTSDLKVHRECFRQNGTTRWTTMTRATRIVKANVVVAMIVVDRGAPPDPKMTGDDPFEPRISPVDHPKIIRAEMSPSKLRSIQRADHRFIRKVRTEEVIHVEIVI